VIELQHIFAGYGKQEVLQDVSVRFETGKLTSIIGVNGCGKSTLLKTILGILPVRSGSITIDGQNLAGMPKKEVARKIAYLSQGKGTPDMTVQQLVLHGRFPHLTYPRRYSKKDRQIAYAAMEQTGIAGYAHMPLYSLSGGMRQTAYIAMALTQNTDYVFLDEPMTYLDISHQLELMKILRTLAQRGKGIVAVMHDLPMAFTFSDEIMLLQDGTVLRSTSPEQLCRENAIEQVFGVSLALSEDSRSYCYRY
jgi:iron complex transport system ATP-binding protein